MNKYYFYVEIKTKNNTNKGGNLEGQGFYTYKNIKSVEKVIDKNINIYKRNILKDCTHYNIYAIHDTNTFEYTKKLIKTIKI